MPFLCLDPDRRAQLRPGDNFLGGEGAHAVPLAALAWLPPAAVVTLRGGAPVEIRRLTAGVVVRVDGQPLGAAPHELRHGARIDVGQCQLRYEDEPRPADDAASAAATVISIRPPVTPATPAQPAASAAARARLVEPGTGRSFPVTDRGVTIGRGTACDVVIGGSGMSRLHAAIAVGQRGFVLTDESSNGTYVNGARITGPRTLAHGDVLRLDSEELRFELTDHGGTPRTSAAADPLAATQVVSSEPPLARLRAEDEVMPAAAAAEGGAAAGGGGGGSAPLATLTVTRGRLAGAEFPIERPVCAVGRGEQNDVRLLDDSVSASHATLLRKRDTWYVVDLRSANGTFVDGSRIAGERALPAGAALRIGNLELTFRPAAAPRATPDATQHVGGLLKRLSNLW